MCGSGDVCISDILVGCGFKCTTVVSQGVDEGSQFKKLKPKIEIQVQNKFKFKTNSSSKQIQVQNKFKFKTNSSSKRFHESGTE